MRRRRSGGGWAAILYTMRMARRVGFRRLWHALRARNACKTCALGMGGQRGGMVNEAGQFPEVCKKSLQAMVADMQGGIPADFFSRVSIGQLQSLSPRELEWTGRLTAPLYAGPGDTHYQTIGWDDALEKLAGQLKSHTPDQAFFYASGRSSNEAGFLLQLFARLYGTNFVNNCSYYCHQASGVGLGRALGTGTATVALEDIESADLVVLIGGNPASNHPRLMTTLKGVRRRGGHVIVVNPLREIGLVNFRVPSDPLSLLFGSKIASLYVQTHVGGDIALLTGVAKLLFERGTIEESFLAHHTDGATDFRSAVERTTWDDLTNLSGVSRAQMEAFADMYAGSHRTVFAWTMGITHHLHGVDNVRMIANLALMRGMVGKPGAGLLPIRGHSNVQGLGTVGVAPQLKQAVLDNLERVLGVSLPRSPGMDTMACTEAAAAGRMKTALCLGGNFYGASPDAQFTKDALGKLDMVCYLNTTLNTGLAHGRAKHTLILPVRARDEEPELTTQESMFSFIRVSEGGPARYPGPKSEVAILAELGRRVFGPGGPVDWDEMQQHASVRGLLAKVTPGLEALAEVDAGKREFTIPGRILQTPRFPTPNGRAQLSVVAIPPLVGSGDQLRLMTIRSEGQFNTVVYEDEDIYRGQERRDVILMHPADMSARGLTPDQRVTVRSACGEMHDIVARAYPDVRAGNAVMYAPEANVLVPKQVDPDSKTPAFKAVAVTVVPAVVPAPARRALATV
ncbi:MAG: FdhF/YdeP family oxidoreductase [Gemmataceae bacterium]|nr:FdhF/YdeP family oxidoreductase [Gemmataceae bacterium]